MSISGMLKSVSRKLQECFKEGFREISRVFQESSKGVKLRLKGVWKKSKGNFREGKFQMSFKAVSRKFWGCSKKVFKVLQGSLKSVSRKFQGGFNKVLSGFQGCLKEVNVWGRVSKVFQGCFKF